MNVLCKLSAAAVFATLAMSSTAALGQGTLEQRIACTPDVFRLCKAEIPNVSKIVSCMDRQKENLSPACKAVFSTDILGPAKSEQAALKK